MGSIVPIILSPVLPNSAFDSGLFLTYWARFGLEFEGSGPQPGSTSLAGWHGGWENTVMGELMLLLSETLFPHLVQVKFCD